MKMEKILLISMMALLTSALISCGSSDSSTAAPTPVRTAMAAMTNAGVHLGKVTYNANGSLATYDTFITSPAGKKVTLSVDDGVPTGSTDDFVAFGLDNTHARYGAIAVYGERDGVNYAVTSIIKDGLEAAGYAPNVARDATYTNVSYSYISADGNTTATDGTITVNAAGSWVADFGDVQLTGNIVNSGFDQNVQGVATLGDMQGGFRGIDGTIAGAQTTFGGYAGSNADGTSVFSGVWGN